MAQKIGISGHRRHHILAVKPAHRRHRIKHRIDEANGPIKPVDAAGEYVSFCPLTMSVPHMDFNLVQLIRLCASYVFG